MREELRRAVPKCGVLDGTAEAIPLGDHSVDAVLVAQAWHWVDPVRAVPEVARVLTPGGVIGLVWNFRDEREDWVAHLGRIILQPGESDTEPEPVVGTPFGELERLAVEWQHRLSPAALVDMVASRSYIIMLASAERGELLEEVRALIGSHPALKGSDELVLPYVTRCYRAQLA